MEINKRLGRDKGLTRDQRNHITAYALIAPVMLYLLAFMLFPLLWAVWTSLSDKSIGADASFVGLANFSELLSDDIFRRSIVNTIWYTVFAVAGKVILGVIMAMVLNAKIPFRNLSRVLMFVPWTIPTLVSALTWKWMYSDVGGVFNFILMSLGFADRPVPWLYNGNFAMLSIVVANIWRGTPFIGISVLAGLQTIPEDIYEAARIDGARTWRTFTRITLPMVRDVIILSTLITTIWTFNDFEIVWLLTGGGPANATQILSTYGYTVGFMNLDLSKAIASSMFALPFLMILITVILRRMRASAQD